MALRLLGAASGLDAAEEKSPHHGSPWMRMAEAGGLFYSRHPDPGQHQALSDKIGHLALNRCGVVFCLGLGHGI